MISTFDDILGGPIYPADPLLSVADRVLLRVLDCTEFHRWHDQPDGSRVACFELVKPLPGLPIGTVLPLADLHAVLMQEVLR